jgi:hypothetical protein
VIVFATALLCASASRAQERPWTLASDSLLYTDTNNVLVVTSQVAAARAIDEGGGQVSATSVVDVVSAASVDVVAQASQRFSEVRGEVNLGASLAVGDGLPSVSYRGSTEPDYFSHGFGAGYVTRLGGADSVASAHYQITLDTIGRSGTPYSTFSRSLTTHSADVGLTQNIDTKTVLRGVFTLTLQEGYQEKPYRFVPLFDRSGLDRAAADGTTLNLDTFDQYRLASRPPEEVPDQRVRNALALRAIHYIDAISGSIRADYRFYFDDWGMHAHTGEVALELAVSARTTFGLFTRAYTQTAASFYRATYVVQQSNEIPKWRTLDRKLAPYDMLTGGARVEYHSDAFTAYVEVNGSYTAFHEYIYLDHVISLIGQGGLAWTF